MKREAGRADNSCPRECRRLVGDGIEGIANSAEVGKAEAWAPPAWLRGRRHQQREGNGTATCMVDDEGHQRAGRQRGRYIHNLRGRLRRAAPMVPMSVQRAVEVHACLPRYGSPASRLQEWLLADVGLPLTEQDGGQRIVHLVVGDRR